MIALWRGGRYLAKYRPPRDISRRADAKARRYLFGDLREKGGLAFDEISFLVALWQNVQPDGHASSVRESDVRFAFSGTPVALETPRLSISGMPGIFRPGQDTADWIIAKEDKKITPLSFRKISPKLTIKIRPMGHGKL